jgi:hypothetical protein
VNFFRICTFVTILALVGCSTYKDGARGIANADDPSVSSGTDLSGTQLGVVRYYKEKYYLPKYAEKRKTKTKKFKALRIYFNKIEGETDSYHAVILEYTNLLRMAPTYIGSNKLPFIQSLFGFLKKILSTSSVYKVTPLAERGTYEMQTLRAINGRLEADQNDRPAILTLSNEENLSHPLSGATISRYAKSKKGHDIDIFFPAIPKGETKEQAKKRKKEAKFGMQYNMAKYVYESKKLESTWRMKFLTGPYLRAYNDKKHKVLDLTKSDAKLDANFIYEKGNRLTQGGKDRRFTNIKSAGIEGQFNVTEPANGMFVFTSTNPANKGIEHVEGRIGLFIDIFDATKSLNQDVVELILVNPNDPADFLMYYEHPDNGEGEKKAPHGDE